MKRRTMMHARVSKVWSTAVLCPLVGLASSLAWALPARGLEVPFTEHLVSDRAIQAYSVFVADVNGDGSSDILSASNFDNKIAWYESDGGSPPTFTEHVISTNAEDAQTVFATDLDGDGDTDVLSASEDDDKIAWYENDGGSPPVFTERVISATADFAECVFATDMDGDGDIDVLSASRELAWYENNGGSPPSFSKRVISADVHVFFEVFATDVDGDGDADVLSASANDDVIVWYESDGGSPPSFTRRVISTVANGAYSVFATDLDGDGDTDVLSALASANRIAWYENDGGVPPSFSEHVISTNASLARSVFAVDVDGDGDTDVLSASSFDDKIAWYESDGGSPPIFVERVISTTADNAITVFAADVDGDGDTDVLSASWADSEIMWYENTSVCYNGGVDLDEECDGGSGCTDCLCDAGFEPMAPRSLNCQPICGNGSLDPDEECDGGLACTSCRCDIDFDPTAPPSLDCQAICGNGSINPHEECDGGVGCTDCLCDADFEPTVPPSLDCQSICGNGSLDAGEQCDGGIACTSCLCDADFEPTAPQTVDCQRICGNGVLDPGEECDGVDDSACPGVCSSICICGGFCGNDACDPSENSCNCPDDCGAPQTSEVLGATCNDGQDNDCDGLTDSADPDCAAIPTVSAWGLVVMALLLLAGAKVYFDRRRQRAPLR